MNPTIRINNSKELDKLSEILTIGVNQCKEFVRKYRGEYNGAKEFLTLMEEAGADINFDEAIAQFNFSKLTDGYRPLYKVKITEEKEVLEEDHDDPENKKVSYKVGLLMEYAESMVEEYERAENIINEPPKIISVINAIQDVVNDEGEASVFTDEKEQ